MLQPMPGELETKGGRRVLVVLKQDVPGLGRKGDTVAVKDGYARNYLIPRGIAVQATEGTLREQANLKAVKQAKEQRLLAEARNHAAILSGKTLVFLVKAGKGRIFGSVTPQEIADKIKSEYNIEVDKRKVLLENNLKELGVHEVSIQLHPSVRATINVEIRAEVGK